MTFWAEARAGTTAGTLAAIQSMTHGLVAFGIFGPHGVAFGMASALVVSLIAGLAMALIGRTRPLIGTTTAGTALVMGSTLGLAEPSQLSEAIGIAVQVSLLAGLLVLVLSWSGLARLAALVPTPVSDGLVNATVVLIVASQLPILLGGSAGQIPMSPSPAAVAVSLVAIGLMLLPVPRVPAPIVALAGATGLHLGLKWAGIQVGPEVANAPSLTNLANGLAEAVQSGLTLAPLHLLLPAAGAIALLATVETLGAAIALRELSKRRVNLGRDLAGAGAGLVAGGMLGGVPAAGLTLPSLTCWKAGGRTAMAQVIRAGVNLPLLLFAANFIAHLPLAALAGVLCGAVLRLLRLPPKFLLVHPTLRKVAETCIIWSVVAVAVAAGVMPAIGTGLLLAVVIFTISMSRSPVRRVIRNPAGRSRVRRSPTQEAMLKEVGHQISLIELEGPVFFGTTERILDQVDAERSAGATIIVFDFSRVNHIDVSGGKRLLDLLQRSDIRVFLSPLQDGNALYMELQSAGLTGESRKGVFPDLASACEAAEDIVLENCRQDVFREPEHADTCTFLRALGLSEASTSILVRMGKEVCIDPGTVIIRAGDPADKLFLLLEGAVQVELAHNLEAKATRLAVFAPGVFFGEAALLGQLRRTANVVARTKARCWQLEAAQFASLKATSPEVAWAVLVVIGRQLASHVSAANSLIDKLES